jgi:hypothetical protein
VTRAEALAEFARVHDRAQSPELSAGQRKKAKAKLRAHLARLGVDTRKSDDALAREFNR